MNLSFYFSLDDNDIKFVDIYRVSMSDTGRKTLEKLYMKN